MSDEESYIAISALQHLSYCPRQFALIHIEKLWADDGATANGHIVHKRVDQPGADSKKGVRTERSVWLAHRELRIRGIADMVEYSKNKSVPPCPVEMKSGKKKKLLADKVQLCAQALCLESIHKCKIEFGYLSYRKNSSRERVDMSGKLRESTTSLIEEAHLLLKAGETPAPIYSQRKCERCSLKSLCQPLSLSKANSAKAYRERMCC